MAEKNEPLVKIQDTPLKQTVLNLETGQDATIEFTQKRYLTGTFNEEALKEARKIVGSLENQITALLEYATRKSYQESKNAALAKGSFLTQELKTKIVGFMRAQQQFSDLTAKDAFERWKTGYLAKKPGAVKILNIVSQSADEFGDL